MTATPSSLRHSTGYSSQKVWKRYFPLTEHQGRTPSLKDGSARPEKNAWTGCSYWGKRTCGVYYEHTWSITTALARTKGSSSAVRYLSSMVVKMVKVVKKVW